VEEKEALESQDYMLVVVVDLVVVVPVKLLQVITVEGLVAEMMDTQEDLM
jgi:hypothetical protein